MDTSDSSSKENSKNLIFTTSQNGKKRSRDVQVRGIKSGTARENEEKLKEENRKEREENSSRTGISRTVFEGASVLKDITNNRYPVENERRCRSVLKKKEEVARERWKILAKALLKPKKVIRVKDISVRRFTSFGLITPNQLEKLDSCWLKYSGKVLNKTYSIEIHHVDQKLTPKELMGFNNTGNICIWPSEEVLAYYLLSKIHWFEGKRILEVGGGMTCMAGLLIAKYGGVREVDLTDGNVMSVKNVDNIIKKNNLDEEKVACFQLDWVDHKRLTKKYDIVLSSDCLFFDETRSDLVETIWNSLEENGLALVMAPRRGKTLDAFVDLTADRGFHCLLQSYYEDTVWRNHLKFKQSFSEYDEDLHYPILIVLTKSRRFPPYTVSLTR